MSQTMFDPEVVISGTTAVRGSFTKIEVNQVPKLGQVSNRVIDPTKPFTIDLAWKLDGVLGNVNVLINSVTDRWNVQVYAEKMGPGGDLQIFNDFTPIGSLVPIPTLPATWTYTCHIPANTLPENLPGSGMYRLCVVVFANTTIAGADDIIGCYEGPMILAENPQ